MLKVINFLFLFIFCPVNAIIDKWESTDFVWNFGIISKCNINAGNSPVRFFAKDPIFDPNVYKNIKKNDIVWLKGRFIAQFAQQVLPKINNKFVLLICDGDESFPTDCVSKDFDIEKFIANKNIIHIFAQNYDYKGQSKKVSHFPIGMDFHTVAYKSEDGGWGEKGAPKEQENFLKNTLSSLQPTYLRKKRAFVDFQLSDTMHGEFKRYLQFGEDRTAIFNYILTTGLIDYSTRFMRRSELWKTKGQYAFSVSPHGNGLDCHRTWEDLVLGCIVIVKTSSLDPLYEDLPVIVVKNWSEITQENLDIWLDKYKDAFTNSLYRYKLTNAYWLNKIYSVISRE